MFGHTHSWSGFHLLYICPTHFRVCLSSLALLSDRKVVKSDWTNTKRAVKIILPNLPSNSERLEFLKLETQADQGQLLCHKLYRSIVLDDTNKLNKLLPAHTKHPYSLRAPRTFPWNESIFSPLFYYPYWQYIDLFIFRFASLLCLRSTLRIYSYKFLEIQRYQTMERLECCG